MSSFRFLNGGKFIWTVFNLWYRSSLNLFLWMASCMFMFVAATILTSVFSVLEDPTFINSPVSNTLNSLTCVARGGGIALGLMDKDFDLFAEE